MVPVTLNLEIPEIAIKAAAVAMAADLAGPDRLDLAEAYLGTARDAIEAAKPYIVAAYMWESTKPTKPYSIGYIGERE